MANQAVMLSGRSTTAWCAWSSWRVEMRRISDSATFSRAKGKKTTVMIMESKVGASTVGSGQKRATANMARQKRNPPMATDQWISPSIHQWSRTTPQIPTNGMEIMMAIAWLTISSRTACAR